MMKLHTFLLTLLLCIFNGKIIQGRNSSEFTFEFHISESKYECDFTGFLTQLFSMQEKHVSVFAEVYNDIKAKFDPGKPLSLYDAILEQLLMNEKLKNIFIESNKLFSRCTKGSVNERSGSEISTALNINNVKFNFAAGYTDIEEVEDPIKHAYERKMNPWGLIEIACEEADAATLMDEINEHISDIENIRSDLEDELTEKMLHSDSNLDDLIHNKCYMNETLQQLTQEINTGIQKCYGSFFGLQSQMSRSVAEVPMIDTICEMLNTMVEYNIFDESHGNDI